MKSLDQVARIATEALTDLGLPSALCGGMAHNVWAGSGGQFSTDDVDLAVLAPEDVSMDAERVAEALQRRTGEPWFFRDRYRRRDRMIYKFQLGEGDDAVHFDLVLPDLHYASQAIEAAAKLDIAGVEGRVLQPEDVILYKALARRPKDVEKILKLHQLIELDLVYLEAWARHLDRWDYVKAALESGGPDE